MNRLDYVWFLGYIYASFCQLKQNSELLVFQSGFQLHGNKIDLNSISTM